MFIYGFSENDMLIIDPHQTKDAVINIEAIECADFHPSTVNTLKIHDLDPSLLIGYYCSDYDEFLKCINSLKMVGYFHINNFRSIISQLSLASFDRIFYLYERQSKKQNERPY